MTVKPILVVGNPTLRIAATPVVDFGPSLKTLINDLHDTLATRDGAGLAAPQIGVGLRVFVLSQEQTAAAGGFDHLVNPTLAFPDDEQKLRPEGCLSVSSIPLYLKTLRWRRVIATGYTVDRRPVEIDAKDFLAQVLQHETDHLDGQLFVEHRTADELETLMSNMRNLAEHGRPAAEPSAHT